MDIAKLGKQFEKYEGKWIAIDGSEEKIVGVGDSALEATEDAERNGYQETILFKVPSSAAAIDSQKSSISNAGTPEEIGEFWDSHSLADHWDKTHEVEFEVRTKD